MIVEEVPAAANVHDVLQKELRQTPVLPEKRLPIVSIGLGGRTPFAMTSHSPWNSAADIQCEGIVHDAHYPAYKIAGFEVAGAFDMNEERAKMMQEKFDIPVLYTSVQDLVERAPHDAIIDIAVHGDKVLDLLKQLPDNRAVLIQKPLGEDLEASRAIRDLCRSKVRLLLLLTPLRASSPAAGRNYSLTISFLVIRSILVCEADHGLESYCSCQLSDALCSAHHCIARHDQQRTLGRSV